MTAGNWTVAKSEPPIITVLGAGHIGETVVAKLLAAGHPADRLRATTRSREHAAGIAARHGIAAGVDNSAAAAGAHVLMVAVRPDQSDAVLVEAIPHAARQASVVSFVAGYSLGQIEAAASPAAITAFRVATNVASLERSGVLAVSPAPTASTAVRAHVATLLRPLGTVVEIPEAQQNMAASTLGSGAAFLAFAAGGIADAAIHGGVDARQAALFAAEALACAAELLRRADPHRPNPWDALATPGGLTEAGIGSLQSNNVARHLAEAVETAVARAAKVVPELPPRSA
ncbi:pyrroline-5-carboxylate reductase family protein [Kitasatospora brasiliensis]|uniref:pyrroline-5-carboxylate reductase family protein n=1 Tax=Kitasatospora brasiliensis TaxID=3058040 RepID=UPI002931AD67|nr:pyrroline-5-carboxylate reductase dimerization domain-containing protein [Kitasatospora sp. K002]